ncbi:type I polyketide synthase [Sphingomonas sp.]|uniref:type I polyketide synthase n=1 Tax=Sphingomonas sp. TaxID=28214 RepID=UPI002DD6BA5F|nr:SDR family NAD(P)-dependent oxidoreductase [Sphingomonas sp.]
MTMTADLRDELRQGGQDEPLEPIAVLAMTGRFPGAPSVAELWEALCAGKDCISDLTAEDLAADGVDPAVLTMPDFVNRAGVLEGIELFDAPLFGFAPREAEIIDPQQRLFLECAWEALELAGHNPQIRSDSVGVYGGASLSGYGLRILMSGAGAAYTDLDVLINNDKDFLATRVAYKLGLKGPAITVQTACSTSLVAVATAVEALRNFHCDLALAGGATVNVPHRQGYFYRDGGIASRDGYCRTFDAAAGGTVGGNGVAVVVLKRLSDAVADRDTIQAVISGVGLNNDGSGKVGFTAPSVAGQAAAIAMAQAQAGIGPKDIGYVECHGTATPLGDPIEVAALRDVFMAGGAATGGCGIGSVKSNVGHLDCAAGVTGLIKAVLCVMTGKIPPSLHFKTPNPQLGIESSPFHVCSALTDWAEPRIAGVSSFGIGGTNAHAIVEEAPQLPAREAYDHAVLLPVSAHTPRAFANLAERLDGYLAGPGAAGFADVAYTLQTGRRRLRHRGFAVIGRHRQIAPLGGLRPIARTLPDDIEPRIAYLIPGQGSQRPGALRDLAAAHSLVAEDLELLTDGFARKIGFDLRDYLLSPDAEPVTDTGRVQPILFAQGYCLGRLLGHLGLPAEGMLGHSLGELVAASLAGSFGIEDAIGIVAIRAGAMAAARPGAMLALPAHPETVRGLIDGIAGAVITAENGPEQTVVGGDFEVIEAVEATARKAGLHAVRLATSHAFHSPSMDEAADRLREALGGRLLRPPSVPFLSNGTGDWITDAQAVDPAYWGSQLRRPVMFGRASERLLAQEGSIVFELGHGTLLGAYPMQLARETNSLVVPVLPRGATDDGWQGLLHAVGRAWVEGARIDWSALYREGSVGAVPLPTYPFERSRYWVDFGLYAASPAAAAAGTPERSGTACYQNVWTRAVAVAGARARAVAEPAHCTIVGAAGHPLAAGLAAAFEAQGWTCDRIDPAAAAISAMAQEPRVVAMLCDDAAQGSAPDSAAGFGALLDLYRALDARSQGRPVTVLQVTSGLFDVVGTERLAPGIAPLEALAICVPQECPNLRTAIIDWAGAADEAAGAAREIAVACLSDHLHLANAIRGKTRWVRRIDPLPLAPAEGPIAARNILITGGLGRLGREMAVRLAERGVKTIALVSRAPDLAQVEVLRPRLGAAGASLVAVACDVSDRSALAAALERLRVEVGAIDGVIHAAGLTAKDGFRPLAEVDAALVARQFAPKVAGTDNLVALLDGEAKWAVLFSSISGTLGGLGFAPYAGANLYLDATASLLARADGPTRWNAVQWDGFTLEGEAGLTVERAVEVIAATAAGGLPPSVVVSAGDLEMRMAHWLYGAGQTPDGAAADDTCPAEPAGHERPPLSTAYAAPETEHEHKMTAIWERLLGIDGLGVDDNFFELGGHSLLGVQLIGQVRATFDRAVPVNEIFESPTVRKLIAAMARYASEDDRASV